ncbi:hypothetical protein GCM10025864_32060 [Luteimicrobium album]|uniref:Protein-glutamine gamma-glutamyltransferase-like C-terminal domain-containing protein n=1 Tax=Luteimicrobium album TaxID=1054550 RepID=A0ABQ6I4P4_9MICO|nr:DUF4129 domain-containing protein [Luteimicrobium album]GMA25447.1 hypothetical protein GCM10025864_32060 [Luteimicrobium album]
MAAARRPRRARRPRHARRPHADDAEPPPLLQGKPDRWHISPWVWVGVVAVVVVAIAIALAFWWRRHHDGHPPDDEPAEAPGVHDAALTEPEAVAEEPDLPVLRRGFDHAFHVLDSGREPHDAIVTAWLGLEEAAQDAGVARRPAETASELTTRILGRVTSDDDAVHALLDLYLRVRYGGYTATPDDVAAARSALERLTQGWDAQARRWSR